MAEAPLAAGRAAWGIWDSAVRRGILPEAEAEEAFTQEPFQVMPGETGK